MPWGEPSRVLASSLAAAPPIAGPEPPLRRRRAGAPSGAAPPAPPAPLDLPDPADPAAHLTGFVDEPAGDTADTDPLVVRGWHAWDGRPAVGVQISLEGRLVATAHPGSERRPDVAAALGAPALAGAGWRAEIPLSVVEQAVPGGARAGVAATVSLGVTVWPTFGGPPVVLPPRPLVLPAQRSRALALRGHLDDVFEHSDDPLPRGPVPITGWALAGDGPVSRVELVVDGQAAARARIGLSRTDAPGPGPYPGVSGFDGLVDLAAVPGGGPGGDPVEVLVEARVHDLSGACATVARRRVAVAPQRALAGPTPPRPAPVPAPAGDPGDLNLLCFTHHLGIGGGQLWLSELLRRAGAGRDFACTVVGPAPGALGDALAAMGVEVHCAGDTPVAHWEAYEGRVAETTAWLEGRGHNAVLVNSFGSFLGADVATRLGLPTVWCIHESWTPAGIWAVAYPRHQLDPVVPATVAQAMGAVGAMIFVAEATRRLWAGAAGPDRSVVVPYGIDTAAVGRYRDAHPRAAVRRELGLPDGARVLLVLGTTEPRKAQTMLASAFAEVAAEFPDVHLVMVGLNRTFYARVLTDLVEELGLEGRVHLVPVVADPTPWLRAADALVCASDVESLPRSVLEAMCFGLPVVATSVYGLPELLTDGRTGFLFEPADLRATVEALRRVLATDGATLSAVGEAGRRLVEAQYDSAHYAAEVLALLEGLRRAPAATPAAILSGSGRGGPPGGDAG